MINNVEMVGNTYTSFLAIAKLVDRLDLSKLDDDVVEVETNYQDKTANFIFKNSMELYVSIEILDDTVTTRYYTTDNNYIKFGKFLDKIEDLYFYNSNFKLSSILYIHYYLMVNNASNQVITKITNDYCQCMTGNSFFVIDIDSSEIMIDTDDVFEYTLVTFKVGNYKDIIELNTYRRLEEKQLYISTIKDYENYIKKDFLVEYNILADDVLNFFNNFKFFGWFCKDLYLDNSNYVFTIDFVRLYDNVKSRLIINQVKIDKSDYVKQFGLNSDVKFNILDINIVAFDDDGSGECVYTNKFEVEWFDNNRETASIKDSKGNIFDYFDIIDLIKDEMFTFSF